MQRKLLVVFALVALALPTAALAQQEDPDEGGVVVPPDPYAERSRIQGLSVFGILGFGLWDFGIGAGARYAFPFAEGVIDSDEVRDEFALEFGLDAVYYFEDDALIPDETLNTVQLLPVVGLLWNFWLADDTIGLYPKFELGYEFYVDDNPIWDEGLYWDIAGGILWNLDSGLTLRGEVSRNLVRLGVAMGF